MPTPTRRGTSPRRGTPPRTAGGAAPTALPSGGPAAAAHDDVTKLGDLTRQTRDLSKSYGAQAAALKRDLALVNRQIEFERERKKEIDRLAEIERVETLPSEHVEAIARRDEDVRAIKTEMASMMEWLRKGVTEAQTISLDCEAMREKAMSANLTEAELRAERDRFEGMERRLTEEVADAAAKRKRLSDASIALDEHADHQRSLLGVTSDITASATADRDRLQTDVDQLQSRAREVETIEIAVGCMAASVRRALHTLESLNKSAEQGALAAEMDDDEDDGYDSDMDADSTKVTPVVLSSTKAKMGRCEALLLTLHSTLKRYEHDEALRQSKFKADYDEELRAASDHLSAFTKRCDAEINDLERIVGIREPQLRTAIRLRDQANASDLAQFGTFAGESNFTLQDYYDQENRQLAEEVVKLQEENTKLSAKVASLEGDYNAVRSLKREYRELEAKKLSLSQSLRKEEQDQRMMKMSLEETDPTQTSRTAALSSQKRPPWRGTTVAASP